jgi:2-polyprenyl-3-methyl-5-hydroxy-6-metoxy-1,4-benzoquinol methylase
VISRLFRLFQRPEQGWDPVSQESAELYARHEWANVDERIVDELERQLGSLEGKRVLDLGGGPGQFSVAFAKRGAVVVWHDISRFYQALSERRAEEAQVTIEFSLGYLEDAQRLVGTPFDLVFNRICWYYCINDAAFARLFYALVKPGGAGYVDCTTPAFENPRGRRRIVYALNRILGWKIGNPGPPHGRIARLFQTYPLERMIIDYASPLNDRVLFVKPKETLS